MITRIVLDYVNEHERLIVNPWPLSSAKRGAFHFEFRQRKIFYDYWVCHHQPNNYYSNISVWLMGLFAATK